MKPQIIEMRVVHKRWTTLGVATIRTASGAIIDREIEDHGRAVAVLPYDRVRRTAMLVRQLRAPMLKAADLPHSLEAPAGILDEIDPADCARREALEECGLRLRNLEFLADLWPMPGLSTERIALYLAPYGEQDRIAVGGGLEHEQEEIEVVEMSLPELGAMCDDGRLIDMKTYLLLQALRLRQPGLFAAR